MITPPPSVTDDVKALVSDLPGKTIFSTYLILDTIETGTYPVVLFWLANYHHQKRQALYSALKSAGLEPYTRTTQGSVGSWKVTS